MPRTRFFRKFYKWCLGFLAVTWDMRNIVTSVCWCSFCDQHSFFLVPFSKNMAGVFKRAEWNSWATHSTIVSTVGVSRILWMLRPCPVVRGEPRGESNPPYLGWSMGTRPLGPLLNRFLKSERHHPPSSSTPAHCNHLQQEPNCFPIYIKTWQFLSEIFTANFNPASVCSISQSHHARFYIPWWHFQIRTGEQVFVCLILGRPA